MWVVKLGGSLANSETLPHWLEKLARTDAVIVPGGGPFADRVRTAQAMWRFDDQTAHNMAILAMHQYGLMLAGLGKLCAVSCVAEIAADFRAGQANVWLPLPENLNAAGIPGSWDITSDSLAAWLAGQLNAEHLLLIKSVSLTQTDVASEQLIADGVIDPAFKQFSQSASFQSWICGREDYTELPRGLQNPERHFTYINHG